MKKWIDNDPKFGFTANNIKLVLAEVLTTNNVWHWVFQLDDARYVYVTGSVDQPERSSSAIEKTSLKAVQHAFSSKNIKVYNLLMKQLRSGQSRVWQK